MKNTFSVTLLAGFISLSGFNNESENYEQLAFDYFVSDILASDFSDITSFEFKGKTEQSFSTLGKYKFCLKPQEKLGSIMQEVTKGSRKDVREISLQNIKGLNIVDFEKKASRSRLFLYPSVHVADNFYVFLSFQKLNEEPVKYVFELTPDGEISRSCRME
jgi:hypothetical protein